MAQLGESPDLSLIGVSVRKLYGFAAALFGVVLVVGGCTSTETEPAVSSSTTSSAVAQADQRTTGWDAGGKPVNGGPVGADGSKGNNLSRDYCAHNQNPKCPKGSYVGYHTSYHDKHGGWNANGDPVNGGPVGANGATNANLTQGYCARNQNPSCPKGSYVGPNAQKDPKGGPHYVQCKGTVCTNPNHGAGTDPDANGGDFSAVGVWDANGNPIAGGPRGSDGSTGNNLTRQYCTVTLDARCPLGSFKPAPPPPAPRDAPPEPGQSEFQGPQNQDPPEPGQNEMQGPGADSDDGDQGNQGEQAPPEPGQNDMQGPGGDDGDGDGDGDGN